MKSTRTSTGIVSFVVLTAILGFMGVIARNLTEFSLLQQVYGRTLLALVFILPIYWRQLAPNALRNIPRQDMVLAVLRGSVYYISVVSVSYAALNTELFVTAALSSLPFAALFGVVILKEKFTYSRAIALVLAIVGVFTMQGLWQTNLQFGYGELAAIGSSILFSFTYIARKWQTQAISNSQQSTVMLLGGGIAVLLISLILREPFLPLAAVSSVTLLWLLLGAAFNAAIMQLTNIGFSNLPAIVGDILLKLTFVFSYLFGLLLYAEDIGFIELLGGFLILIGTIYLSIEENKTNNS